MYVYVVIEDDFKEKSEVISVWFSEDKAQEEKERLEIAAEPLWYFSYRVEKFKIEDSEPI